MSIQKKKLTFKNKHNELEKLVEQEDNHLELIINRYLDEKILLQDILIKQAQNDEDLENKICNIYC
jgi:hypothetical protein